MARVSKKQFDLFLFVFILFYIVVFSLLFYNGKRIEGHIIRTFGSLAFLMLSVALSIGPLAWINPFFKKFIAYRRHLGVATSIVASIHGLFSWFLIADFEIYPMLTMSELDFDKIPFEIFGLLALAILLLLSLTSNNFSTVLLKEKWKSLHVFIYLAYTSVILHIAFGSVYDKDGEKMFLSLYAITGMVLLIVAFSLWKSAKKHMSSGFIEKVEHSEPEYLKRFLNTGDTPQNKIKTSTQTAKTADKAIVDKNVTMEFSGDLVYQGKSKYTILENSLDAGIDHVHECGGNARCSTCRVVVLDGLENCLPRNQAERELAEKKMLNDEVRLACQTRVKGDVKLRRLVFDQEDIQEAVEQSRNAPPGKEMNLAVLFSDIRSFTSFTEENLPYDVVHMLNKYFNQIGKPIDDNGGFIDKYMGDGIMVLFGLAQHRKSDPCMDAILAAKGMLEELKNINQYLLKHFNHEFRIGIGIHYGPVIVGEMGFHLKKNFTALGDTVNLASRIESKTKDAKTEILVSETVYNQVKDQVKTGNKYMTKIKGKSGEYLLYEIV